MSLIECNTGLPHSMGANLYRLIAGSLRKNMTLEDIRSLVGDAFATVHFPSMPCHLWRVEKVDA